MKTIALAAVAAALLAGPALAQAQGEHAQHASTAPSAAGALSVETTPVGKIIENEKAKAVLEKEIPQINQYYDMIREMTLAQVAPMSQGAIDDAKLKAIQAEFDKIK